MKAYPANLQEFSRSLERAGNDLYSFAVICASGAMSIAEPILQDTLLLGLEKEWFAEDFHGEFTHSEFRDELFHEIWVRAESIESMPQLGIDVPLGHQEMAFYKLPLRIRAALYLRTRRKLAYASIGTILEISAMQAREDVEKARALLLGRKPKEMPEDEF